MAIKTEELDQYVKLAAKGDKTSFEELYRQTCSTVYFTCLSFLKNEQDAADMTQEVYVTVLDSLSTLEEPGKFMPWLNRITVNKCKNRLKAAKAVPMDMEEENQPVEENENFLPEEYITNQAKRRIVMDIMKERLTEAQYQTVIMFYFNELTAQEISEIMECPIGTVTYRLSVAREKIRQGVSEYENKSHDKLYTYASAVPLLAGLLTAEALSLNVQAAAADAASIANAASAIDAAKTAKGGIIKKMLKSPKIMIAAAAAAVVIIGGITAAVVTANRDNAPASGAQSGQESLDSDEETDRGNPQTGSHEETDQENAQAASDAETGQEDQQTSSDTDELVFWLHTADWGEEKDLTGITLFNGECTTPIRMEDFDGDEHLGPYSVQYSYGNIDDIAYSYNLTELIISDNFLGYGERSFRTQESYSFEEGRWITHGEENPSTVCDINLCNYTEDKISLKEAYENNWFYITAFSRFRKEFGENNIPADAILNAMIDKYGRPSYLIAYEFANNDSFYETYEKNDGTIDYWLIWEKEDFVLIMNVMEIILSDSEIYHMKIDDIGQFTYITRELWDNYKDEYLDNRYSSSPSQRTYYDLDDLK